MKNSREQEILNELVIKGRLGLADVMEKFSISESTARRLFTKLERKGMVIRTHGGIQQAGMNFTEYSFERVSHAHLDEKNAIAAVACDILEDGDIIFCDTGTTVLCFCMELARRVQNGELDVTIYTNSLANLEVLSTAMTIYMVGGEYRDHRKDFCGYIAEKALERLNFSKCFLGADGCDMKKYFTTTDFNTANLDEIAIRNSKEVFILTDSSKFSRVTQIGYAPFELVDTLITDNAVDPSVKKKLESRGLNVLTAP
ncbi:MAG: DeoR/GlpR transcriptional regulator [Clostridiales bacterium]|nr:DeoR/GlpR transcriptional regulator [Clostridiales bacterium]